MTDREFIYECIPENSRERYGSTKEEQIDNFIKEHPELLEEPETEPKLESEEDILDYIVTTLVHNISVCNMAFKGGYILNKRIKNCRKTYDVDFSIERKELYQDVKNVLKDVGDYLCARGLVVGYEIKLDITETSSGGIKFIYSDGSKVLGVDVGLHTLGFGIENMEVVDTDINVFTVERSIADKLSVLCSRKRFRRVKDVYDIYMLSMYMDMQYSRIVEALSYREVNWDLYPSTEEQLVQLGRAYEKFDLSRNSTRKIPKPEYKKVLEQLLLFCDPWLSGYTAEKWDSKRGCWL